ncbi:9152_t:CDS:2 [Racocetra fulgida]|uniref:9152_t:CDS:1 n=1 Tax=Racocetra fulgida TaxID=60492 RepID=A0A9N9FY92_9GLOM|nr:9152_t:CDS:2 [Racocetra fulgida]
MYPDGRYAYSSEYDLTTGKSRTLNLKTNTFCSAGSFIENGTLIESGGAENISGAQAGFQSVRLFNSCDDGSCDWLEFPVYLNIARWYNTMVTLPDDIPGGPRTYPVTGTIFLLPLHYENNYTAEIVACGGSADVTPESESDNDCARLNLAQPDGDWTLEPFGDFETGRLMGDHIHMPDGKVLIVNGAGMGYADEGNITDRQHAASLPQKVPLLYDPKAPLGSRFTRMAEAKYVRVYHSTATLIPDGTVFVAGSNPNALVCDICEYPTE